MTPLKPHMLILGGTGYLGSKIAEASLAAGFRVSIFGRREIQSAHFAMAEISFQGETDGLFVVDAPANVDVIVNAMTNYGRAGEAESEIYYANRIIPRSIFQHYFKDGAKPPLLFLNIDTALGENVSVYAKSKAAFRKDLVRAAVGGAPVVGLRLDQFYGAGDAETKFVTMLIRKFMAKSESIALSTGLQKRRFTTVGDVLKTVMELVDHAISGRLTYGSDAAELLPLLGVESTIKDLVLKIQKLAGGEVTRLDFGAVADRPSETDPRNVPAGYEFLEKRVFTGLEEGLTKTIASEKQR